MDTKWRKFSRSRAVKNALVAAYIICTCLIGVITGYMYARGYFKELDSFGGNRLCYASDTLMSDSFASSKTLANALSSEAVQVKGYISDEKMSRFVSSQNMYLYVEANGNVPAHDKGGNPLRDSYHNDITPFVTLTFDENGYSADGWISFPNSADYHNRMSFYRRIALDDAITSVTVGLTETDYMSLKNTWDAIYYNMRVIIITDAVLFVVSIALLLLLCRVFAEEPDGTVRAHRMFGTFYEILAGLVFADTIGITFLIMFGYDAVRNVTMSQFLQTAVMLLAGVVSAAYMLLWLYLSLCVCARLKTNTFVKGFLILRVLLLLCRGAKKAFTGARLFFTGELFRLGTAARRYVWIDAAFIAATSVLLIIFMLNAGRYDSGWWLAILAIILEIPVLGLFVFARFLMLRDIARIERQIHEVYDGNYTYTPVLSKNSPYEVSSNELGQLGEQYHTAVAEAVKSERLKIDLVTNVSHDLKTPLTSIISYVELLSKEDLPPEAEEYVSILRMKSERLKNIVSDVFELAKTTSGEINVERVMIDLNKLSYQALADMEDRINESGLELRASICEPPVAVCSDGSRIYRIIQNLFDNALKYSMRGTRIYYSLEKTDREAVITLKNIAAYEMTFTKDDILERFARGDKMRTTEGSGLGLSIAQGFAIACGGRFDIDIDGDMFKATAAFPLVRVKESEYEIASVSADE